jgi:hypothetical protein
VDVGETAMNALLPNPLHVSSLVVILVGGLFAAGIARPTVLGDTPAVPDPGAVYEALGGNWFRERGEVPRYLYRDAGRYVDLFSYHSRDSNKDGIPNLRISHDQACLILESQGYPNHPTAIFPNDSNPNSIRVQDFKFRLPLRPREAKQITRLPMGPVGMALNGVVFFNPFEAGGMNAVEGYDEVWLDSCCGHPQQTGVYHYHKYPSCVKSPFADDGKQHSPVIGFAFDGFPIYGPYEAAGVFAKDLQGPSTLDVCNGHRDDERGYHYHVTPGLFPYILGGYRGEPELSNNRGLRHAGEGAIVNNALPGRRRRTWIAAVTPGSGRRGSVQRIAIELAEGVEASRIPAGSPSWLQVGPYEAKAIQRKGNRIEAEVAIPEDAPVGILLDCHLEFAQDDVRRGPIVLKQNDTFRVLP